MKIAYADPPYIGCAATHYRDHPDYAGEVDHDDLLEKLSLFDGWALSLHTNSLRDIWPKCEKNVRCAAWVKPFAWIKPGVRPTYAWEPVLFKPARTDRQLRSEIGRYPFIRDWHSGNAWGVTREERQNKTKGRKRVEFCEWIFQLLMAVPTDDFVDMFPGSGVVSESWERWRKRGHEVREVGR